MVTAITNQELFVHAMEVKAYINRELVKLRLDASATSLFTSQELYHKLDLIHEAERTGFRRLDDRMERKLGKMLREVQLILDAEVAKN